MSKVNEMPQEHELYKTNPGVEVANKRYHQRRILSFISEMRRVGYC
jgi:hypothetical protein